jgi:hypothetical protein
MMLTGTRELYIIDPINTIGYAGSLVPATSNQIYFNLSAVVLINSSSQIAIRAFQTSGVALNLVSFSPGAIGTMVTLTVL